MRPSSIGHNSTVNFYIHDKDFFIVDDIRRTGSLVKHWKIYHTIVYSFIRSSPKILIAQGTFNSSVGDTYLGFMKGTIKV